MPPTSPTSDQLRPWQFFTLGGLVCATVAVFVIRGTSAENLILVCLGVFAAALVGLAALNALRPLVTGETREPEMVGGNTRAAIEREKNLVLRSIKELEFDHAMGKVAEGDYEEMVGRLRSRAVRLLEQLDKSGSGYREIIERELASRLVKAGTTSLRDADASRQMAEGKGQETAAQDFSPGICAQCGTSNDADARFCKSCGTKVLALFLALFIPFSFFLFPFTTPAFAQLQMPDPKQMSGIPRPVTDLPTGHVSVRLIRGQLSNNIQGHPVEIHAGGKILTIKTDENGRAQFSGVATGTTVKAVAVVDGERLESQDFPWPGDGGIRVMLVATAKGGEAPLPVFQPVAGNVMLGDQTRVIIDPEDGSLQVYYILDIQNSARAPVNPSSAVFMDMPTGAQTTTILRGGPQAVARGDRVTVTGPFAPGATPVEVAYRMPFDTGDVTIQQTMSLPVPGLAVLIKKVGDLGMTSPQLPNVQEREFDGERYILGQGPAIPAGGILTLNISGLPHKSPIPRRLALVLALLMIGGGTWAATRTPSKSADTGRTKQLTTRREKLFGDLVRLEQQKRAGDVDAARYAERRTTLIAQLERVYRDLDAQGGQGAVA
ncbi:MAG TPA: zinc ribbon domain-containing protein [Vicinamibacterales bacterium]|nr:zinc ribbon domain-containing protein [Vicinamibacterales bacterium]